MHTHYQWFYIVSGIRQYSAALKFPARTKRETTPIDDVSKDFGHLQSCIHT